MDYLRIDDTLFTPPPFALPTQAILLIRMVGQFPQQSRKKRQGIGVARYWDANKKLFK
jgi:hypothetical protein